MLNFDDDGAVLRSFIEEIVGVVLPLFGRKGHEFIVGDGPVIIGHCIL